VDVRALRRAMEVDNSLTTAELMARAALMRRESRGSHYREDYPQRDDDHWKVNILLRIDGERMVLRTGVL
jgi:succinate dehydrogenase/fumarate reductase flavoprotein subunit